MQVKIEERDLEIEALNIINNWIEIDNGLWINVLHDSPKKQFTTKEKNIEINKSADRLRAIAFNNSKEEIYEIFKKTGIKYDTDISVKNRNSKVENIKKKSKIYFDVVIRDNKEVIEKMELGFNERAIYRELCHRTEHKTLMVVVDNAIPTLEVLSKEIGLTPRVISKYLQSLEDRGLIYREQIYSTKAIYVNPMFYSTSTQLSEINEKTLSYFGLDATACVVKQCHNRYKDIL